MDMLLLNCIVKGLDRHVKDRLVEASYAIWKMVFLQFDNRNPNTSGVSCFSVLNQASLP